MRIAKLILQSNITSKKTGFSLVELLAAIGILVSFLAVSLVAFTSTQKLSEETQQSTVALQAAKAKLEEMRAYDFATLQDDYTFGGAVGSTFDIFDSVGNPLTDYKGSIVLTDVYDDDITLTQPYLGGHDDNPSVIGDNWIEATNSANWSGRNGHASVVFNDKMWVLGGIDAAYSNDVWYSEDGVNWTEATTLNTKWSGRYDHASVAFNDNIWVLGGGSYLNDVWYSLDGADWTEATNSANWSGRIRFPSVVFDNKIWVLGGKLNSTTEANDVWYSSDGADWTEATSSADWSKRFGHTAAVFDNKIWVLGGTAISGGDLNDVWYSEDGADWTEATSTAGWTKRWNHTSVVFDNKIWVLGGGDSSGEVSDVWYSSDGVNWTEPDSAAGWSVRSGFGSVAYGGKIWVLGGSLANRLNDVWWTYGPDRMYQIDITVSYRQRSGRIIGEDNGGDNGSESPEALNGIIDSGEDVDADGILDSTIHATGLIARRGYPAQIYMGKE